jgi:hypothetical protein
MIAIGILRDLEIEEHKNSVYVNPSDNFIFLNYEHNDIIKNIGYLYNNKVQKFLKLFISIDFQHLSRHPPSHRTRTNTKLSAIIKKNLTAPTL